MSAAACSSSSWLEHAACRGQPTAWFFAAEQSFEHALALRVCRSCPVMLDCRADVLAFEHDYDREPIGIVGGLTADQRHQRSTVGIV